MLRRCRIYFTDTAFTHGGIFGTSKNSASISLLRFDLHRCLFCRGHFSFADAEHLHSLLLYIVRNNYIFDDDPRHGRSQPLFSKGILIVLGWAKNGG